MATYPRKMRLVTKKFDRTEKNKPVQYQKGDIVELSESEYLAFGDKFAELPNTEKAEASKGTELKPAKTPTAPPGAPKSA